MTSRLVNEHSSPQHVHGAGNERAMGIAALLTGSFMVAEVVGGVLSGSLALLADAGHMLSDFGSLVLAWFALRLARRPAAWYRTFGFDRFSVLAAFVNGITLFVVAGWICLEAYERYREPVEIVGELMLWVAIGGLIINMLSFLILSRREGDNLNIRAAILHVAGDLLGSVGALVASLVIIFTGWTPIDPLLSMFVAVIILPSAWHVVRESGNILLEGAPKGFDRGKIVEAILEKIPDVTRIQHFHAWSITQERPMATLEVTVVPNSNMMATKRAVKSLLEERFGMDHVTVEIDDGVDAFE
jgi:cobalt-zinc-cadmium efflux system protein